MAFFLKVSGIRRTAAGASAALLLAGCAALFGWDIHAPGILSQGFYGRPPYEQRLALYLPPKTGEAVSLNRGSRFADPQTYHVGEALVPMLIEAFQESFSEFVFLEAEPSADILQGYGIPYLVAVSEPELGNRVTLKGQMLEISTLVEVYDSKLLRLVSFRARGASDAEEVFARKGGPEVNLNAALERNIIATVDFLRDWFREREEK